MGVTQTFTRGCLNVLTVVMAIELLDMGEAGVGVLSAAVGAGAVLGSLGASLLVRSRRLGAWFGVSIALWGLPLVLLGAANALLDVSGFSVIARLAPDEVLARVFGIFEALIALTLGLGSILTPLVIDGLDVRSALVIPDPCARRWPLSPGSGSGRDEELAQLRTVPMLRPLPVPVTDHLARNLDRARVPAGQTIFEQGDLGDRFYVIAAGEADVFRDGSDYHTLRSGDSFGEIALLRDVPRTAEVRAHSARSVRAGA